MEIQRVALSVRGASGGAAPQGAFAEVLERLKESAIVPQIERWHRMERAVARAEHRLGKEGRAVVELQLLAQRVGAEAQLTAAVGEAFSGLLKRINQLAGGG